MSVPSFPFLAFALFGALIYQMLPARGSWRPILLLVLNLVFFASFVHGWSQALPYAAFLLLGWAGVYAAPRSRALGLIFIAAVILGFFWLKMYTFIPNEMRLPFSYTTIGLSYVFFRVLHLVIDAGQKRSSEPMRPLNYLNFTLNFTALVSGPIQMYPDYKEQQDNPHRLDIFALSAAFERILAGFFKVLVVSALLMKAQHLAIDDLAQATSLARKIIDCALIAAIYPLFIYADFSGYTDFVIGIARLYNLKLPENFYNPFIAENFITFWSRWHISLSNWLKTYVYTPLLMTLMRRVPSTAAEPFLAVITYFVTFFLVGAWHGQTTMFMFYGVLQGGGVAGNKLYQTIMIRRLSRKGYRALCAKSWYRVASRGLTFTWFAFTLLWFWSSWDQLGLFIGQAGWMSIGLGWLLVFAIAVPALSLLHAIQAPMELRGSDSLAVPSSRYWRTAVAAGLLVVVGAVTILQDGQAPDIVYKNF